MLLVRAQPRLPSPSRGYLKWPASRPKPAPESDETWAGDIHPVDALRDYRRASGIDARLVVVGMVSNGFSIADPADPGMLDVAGFDTATPQLISDFAGGAL